MKSPEKSLIILRGLPGSGKTTLAHLISADGQHPVFGIDDYFTDGDGNYHFDHLKNHLAYKHCETRTKQAMEDGLPIIILDNTYTLEWEIEPYFKLASDMGYQVHVMTVENRHHGQNTHGIPDDQIEKMKSKYKVVL
ncbi:MAG: AAA family ATPase [Flavobacteriales bacterium]|nr:AAA family ATPase [Flavobacteriales bacterium]